MRAWECTAHPISRRQRDPAGPLDWPPAGIGPPVRRAQCSERRLQLRFCCLADALRKGGQSVTLHEGNASRVSVQLMWAAITQAEGGTTLGRLA